MEKSKFESILTRQPFALFWHLGVIASIFLCNRAGWYFRSPSGEFDISSIWPAAGLALALLVLFGRKAIYSIFIGNFLYEMLFLHSTQAHSLFHFVGALSAAFGQSLGAYVGYLFLKKYVQKGLFYSVSDTSVFLILGGCVSSIILPSFLMTAFSFSTPLQWEPFFSNWFQLWVSNVSGIFIFTPFLIVWGRNTVWKWDSGIYFQAFLFIIAWGLITYFAEEYRLGLIYLYLPWLLWISSTFGQLGATAAILLFAVSTLFLAGTADLTFIIAFVDILIAAILFLLGALEENKASQNELKDYSNNLESKIKLFAKTRERKEERSLQNTSAGILSIGIAHQLNTPVRQMAEHAEGATSCMDVLRQELIRARPALHADSFSSIEANVKTLQACITSIHEGALQAAHLLKAMNQQTSRERNSHKEFKPTELHALLNSSLGRNLAKQAIIDPHFKVEVVKNFSPRIHFIQAVSGDLDQTFYHLFDNALYAMKEKQEKQALLGKTYKPKLEITTENRGNSVEITITDNGTGIPPNALFKIFQPFFTTKSSGTFSGIGLSIAFEIIEKEHHGKIEVDSNEDQFTSVKLNLPIGQ